MSTEGTPKKDGDGSKDETEAPRPDVGTDCPRLKAGEKAPAKPADPTPYKPKCCNCPSTPPTSETCFDTLIAQETVELKKAELAKSFKAELEDRLKKATAAKQGYSRAKYDEFGKRWDAADKEIVNAIHIVTCNLDCWWCLIDCEFCSLIHVIRELQKQLDGDGTPMKDIHSLRDLQYWHQRNRDARAAQFDRFKKVLDAWNNPAATIDQALQANDKVIKSIRTLEPAEAMLQVLTKVIPLHLAIAPRDKASEIPSKYIDLCCGDRGDPDNCCGVDVGVLSVRIQELVGPQAYIVDPDNYMHILCCLVEKRYLPAKQQLATAESDLAAINDEITRKQADLERRKKSILDDFRRNIVTPIDCRKNYQPKPKDGNSKPEDENPQSTDGSDGGNGCGCGRTRSPTEQS
jgi:hypothetical protein